MNKETGFFKSEEFKLFGALALVMVGAAVVGAII